MPEPICTRSVFAIEVAHEAHGVEAVGLGHPHEVEPGVLELDHLAGRRLEPTCVVEWHRQSA